MTLAMHDKNTSKMPGRSGSNDCEGEALSPDPDGEAELVRMLKSFGGRAGTPSSPANTVGDT